MIRVLLYLALIALVAAGVVWLADRPGDVAIIWLGLRIETSVMVAAAALGFLIVIAIFFWSIVRFFLRSPDLVSDLPQPPPRRARLSRDLARPGRDRRGRRARCAQSRRRSPSHRARRAARAPARRADRAALRRPRRRRAGVPRNGGARRHQAARSARPLRRGAAARRIRSPRAPIAEEAANAAARARLGRPGGAGIPLRGGRLGRRARGARPQPAATA